ncbi:50S ribosomal protein L15 [Bythopirellula goksoeyrii]|uniref:Large ribosomal subunit protein uL15 n=1 Tax=Bythopirellula goksoeyrii TaxID=1400387 RepID=A0A5B9Q8E7_9BACT|nr:50S ribosomal protein L15 [Bythopirellula goksoeyrii]QEG33712.1 50S ribosomal protein L15 [Bythopirellula goksoeyrii]
MILNDVHRGIQKNKKRKRLGRGPGSGHGKTAGRGHKGQGSRSGVSSLSIWVGGMTPLVRRVPKRGFHNQFGLEVAVVNVGQLDKAFAAGEEVTLEALEAKNLAKGRFDLLKVLGDGELTKKLKIHAHQFSKSAIEKIEKAGCEKVVLPGKTPVAVKQRAKRQAKKS